VFFFVLFCLRINNLLNKKFKQLLGVERTHFQLDQTVEEKSSPFPVHQAINIEYAHNCQPYCAPQPVTQAKKAAQQQNKPAQKKQSKAAQKKAFHYQNFQNQRSGLVAACRPPYKNNQNTNYGNGLQNTVRINPYFLKQLQVKQPMSSSNSSYVMTTNSPNGGGYHCHNQSSTQQFTGTSYRLNFMSGPLAAPAITTTNADFINTSGSMMVTSTAAASVLNVNTNISSIYIDETIM
jgi:hypothetical protein